jgi:hypothetical protein
MNSDPVNKSLAPKNILVDTLVTRVLINPGRSEEA